MTNQSQITSDELSAKWSNLLNQAFIQIIALEKQLAAQAAFIQELTASQAALEAKLVEPKETVNPYSANSVEQGSAIITDGK